MSLLSNKLWWTEFLSFVSSSLKRKGMQKEKNYCSFSNRLNSSSPYIGLDWIVLDCDLLLQLALNCSWNFIYWVPIEGESDLNLFTIWPIPFEKTGSALFIFELLLQAKQHNFFVELSWLQTSWNIFWLFFSSVVSFPCWIIVNWPCYSYCCRFCINSN